MRLKRRSPEVLRLQIILVCKYTATGCDFRGRLDGGGPHYYEVVCLQQYQYHECCSP